jgi:hypothetical protein
LASNIGKIFDRARRRYTLFVASSWSQTERKCNFNHIKNIPKYRRNIARDFGRIPHTSDTQKERVLSEVERELMDTEEASQITQLGTPECVQLQPKHANTYWMWDLDFLDWETLPMSQTEQALPKDCL